MPKTPLVAHIIYRLGVGGLENGLVNLVNRTASNRYRHAIICLKDADQAFAERIRGNVPIFALNRREGHDFAMFAKIYRLLRDLRPDIAHTRNLATVECQLPAWAAGVSHRVHGEHGWDVFDPDGSNRKYRLLRRAFSLLVHRYIPLSRHLEEYLREGVGISAQKITRICNGVDTQAFYPDPAGKASIRGCPFERRDESIFIGAVGRMHGVKDQTNLVRAFLRLLRSRPEARRRARLILVGDGPLREQALNLLNEAGALDLAWAPGERSDIADIMRGLDLFVLPSLAEGISNTILEAMATGLPVLATAVGGNPDLVADGETGRLVARGDPEAMAAILAEYLDDPSRLVAHGAAGLFRAREMFSLDGMVESYLGVYDELLRTSEKS
jgi:sugar transferase (PEP-CTERM/EpsH1 system associated)